MIEDRVQFALEKFLTPNYFSAQAVTYELMEHDSLGKSILKLNVGTVDNLCRQNYDNPRPRFSFIRTDDSYGMDHCIDHFVLRKRDDYWELHMIEMKTTLGLRTWEGIRRKMRASYLKIRALAVFLGIELSDEHIFAYTTYERADFSINQTLDPRIFLPSFGQRANKLGNTEWLENCIYLPITEPKISVKLPHRGIQMRRNEEGYLEGECTL